jgi:hypothetical protein
VGFEPTIAVLERAKTVRALDRSTTAIGLMEIKGKESKSRAVKTDDISAVKIASLL